MTSKKKFAAAALATTAAAVFSMAPMSTAQAGSAEPKVHCFGVNKCKGHNDCKTEKNACKGHGAGKGQGFVTMSKHACEEIGGSVDKPKE